MKRYNHLVGSRPNRVVAALSLFQLGVIALTGCASVSQQGESGTLNASHTTVTTPGTLVNTGFYPRITDGTFHAEYSQYIGPTTVDPLNQNYKVVLASQIGPNKAVQALVSLDGGKTWQVAPTPPMIRPTGEIGENAVSASFASTGADRAPVLEVTYEEVDVNVGTPRTSAVLYNLVNKGMNTAQLDAAVGHEGTPVPDSGRWLVDGKRLEFTQTVIDHGISSTITVVS